MHFYVYDRPGRTVFVAIAVCFYKGKSALNSINDVCSNMQQNDNH